MKKVFYWLNDHVEEIIMAILMTIIVFVMTLQICMRYFFANSLEWPEELARYCFIWLVFIGMGYSTKHEEMLRVNIIEVLAPVTSKVLNVIQDIISTAFLIFMFQPGINVLIQLGKFQQISPALHISMRFVFLSFEIGIIFALFRMVQKYVVKFLSWKKGNVAADTAEMEDAK